MVPPWGVLPLFLHEKPGMAEQGAFGRFTAWHMEGRGSSWNDYGMIGK